MTVPGVEGGGRIAGKLETDASSQLTRHLHHIVFISCLTVLFGCSSAGVAIPHREFEGITITLRPNLSIREETSLIAFAQLSCDFRSEAVIRILACALQQVNKAIGVGIYNSNRRGTIQFIGHNGAQHIVEDGVISGVGKLRDVQRQAAIRGQN